MHEIDWAHSCPHLTHTASRRKGFPVKRSLAAVAAFLLVVTGLVALLGSPAQADQANGAIRGHVQNLGWTDSRVSDGDPAVFSVGTTGRSLRLEAIKLAAPWESSFSMRGHVQNLGWGDQTREGMVGTTGRSLRLEAVRLTPYQAGVSVFCQAHVQNLGWMPPVQDGATCGTTGRSLRLEAVRIWWTIGPKPVPTQTPTPTVPPTTPPAETHSKIVTVGDIGLEDAGLGTLSAMGDARADLALILGDLAYSPPASAFCDQVRARIPGPVGWVQGNHENRDADVPGGNPAANDSTPAYAACMPGTPGSSGEVGVQQVIQIPGARVITASPQEAEPGAYLVNGPRWSWVRDQIRAAKTAGDWPILAMHEPHWTSGLHGSAGPESKALSDLAITEGVRLVLGAHDHNWSRISLSGTTFVVSGMGGHNLRTANNVPGFVTCTGKPGLLTLDITRSKIVGQVSGICTDRFEITR